MRRMDKAVKNICVGTLSVESAVSGLGGRGSKRTRASGPKGFRAHGSDCLMVRGPTGSTGRGA